MSTRVYELARELNVKARNIVAIATKLGVKRATPMTTLPPSLLEAIKRHLLGNVALTTEYPLRPGIVLRTTRSSMPGQHRGHTSGERSSVNVLEVGRVPWTLLPPGALAIKSLLARVDRIAAMSSTTEWDQTRLSRICSELRPSHCWCGEDEFSGYVAFGFPHRSSVVLDNPLVGNALYIIHRDWMRLSRLSKAELIGEEQDQVCKVVHRGDWMARLKSSLG